MTKRPIEIQKLYTEYRLETGSGVYIFVRKDEVTGKIRLEDDNENVKFVFCYSQPKMIKAIADLFTTAAKL